MVIIGECLSRNETVVNKEEDQYEVNSPAA